MVGSKRIARIKRKAKAASTARAVVAKVAVGYVRVSTDEQAATGFGLATRVPAGASAPKPIAKSSRTLVPYAALLARRGRTGLWLGERSKLWYDGARSI